MVTILSIALTLFKSYWENSILFSKLNIIFIISVLHNWPSRGFPSFKFSNRRSLFFPWHVYPALFSHILSRRLLPLQDKVNVNGFFATANPTIFFSLPLQSSSLPLASSRSSFHLRQDFRIMTKIWRAQRWFPTDTFRIFQAPPGERVFPLRQPGTLVAGWL